MRANEKAVILTLTFLYQWLVEKNLSILDVVKTWFFDKPCTWIPCIIAAFQLFMNELDVIICRMSRRYYESRRVNSVRSVRT